MEQSPVLVVGAGPVGMIAALELARYGVRSVLIEQRDHTTRHPKLDIVNSRSMELLARLDLTEEIRAAGVGPKHTSDVIWSTGLAGEPITVWKLPSVSEAWQRIQECDDGSQPAQPAQRLSQIVLEPVLRARCQRDPLIDVRTGWRFLGADQDATGVTGHLEQTSTGRSASIRSAYLLGCDGAGSQVRRQLGIGLDGSGVDEMPNAYMIHLRSRDLTSLHRHGPFWHYFAFRYVILAQDEVDTWTVHLNGSGPDDFDPLPTDPLALLRETIGTDLAVDEVLLTSLWRPSFLIADRYRDGRILLAGDSAHQMFPTGGYGMNTGVADAVDAAWKIAAILNGWGGPALLDSYEVERRPVGLRNMRTSRRHLGIHLAAGRRLRAGATLPELAAFLQAERGENEYAGVELGYRYTGSPIVCPDDANDANDTDDTDEPAWRPDRYTPTTWPGGRPPSTRLDSGLSIFDHFGPDFTLVDFAGDGRAAGLLAAARSQRVPVLHLVVADRRARELWERDLVLVRPDQHVAWRGNAAPSDPDRIVSRVRGAGT